MTKQDKSRQAPVEKAEASRLPPGLDKAPNHLIQRIRCRNEAAINKNGRCVVYWMQRAQRAAGNPALDTAIYAANALKKPLLVLFCLDPGFAQASSRHFDFMIRGLRETAAAAVRRGAHFITRLHPNESPVSVCEAVDACLLMGDENPLRGPETWRQETSKRVSVPFYTVDADVVVPSKHFQKEEYAARTLRPKILRVLEDFLVTGYEPKAKTQSKDLQKLKGIPLSSEDLLQSLPLSDGPGPLQDVPAGTAAATAILSQFVENHLSGYPKQRNHPENFNGTSGLSPYLHFGQIDARTVALAVKRSRAPKEAKDAFLDELIVRRELAVNFVAHNPSYDSYEGLPEWARKTLEEHLDDTRHYVYSLDELEQAETHDPLWNAAQKEMIFTGRTHGYVRMYWAKKILEWSEHPEEAMKKTILLNDRYFLDGRDPSGYANIAWAIGGKHDRPWPEREIFGKVRYMSFKSTSRKFRSKDYMKQVDALDPS